MIIWLLIQIKIRNVLNAIIVICLKKNKYN